MPGFVGLVNTGGLSRPCDDLDQMVQMLMRQENSAVDRYEGEQAGLAGIRLDDEKTVAYRPGLVLVAVGELVETQRLTQRLRDFGRDTCGIDTLSDLLLELYCAFGIAGVTGLNGAYAAAIWEPDLRRLTLVRDRLGIVNLYYWQANGLFAVATEYKAICWHPRFDKTIDLAAVADMFINNTMQSERTFFAAIHSVPPASTLTYHDGQVDIQSYWRPRWFSSGASPRQVDDYVDGLDHYLRQAVRRRVRLNAALLLTGGLDSRVIAELYSQVAPDITLQTNSIGSEFCSDVTIGRQVAQSLGYSHDWIPLDDSYYQRCAAQGSWRSEGKIHSYASWIYVEEPYLREKGLRYALTGLYGNFISGRHYSPALLEAASIDQAVKVIRQESGPRIRELETLMREAVSRQAIPASLECQEELFRRSDGPDLLNRFDDLGLQSLVAHTAQNNDIFGDAARGLDPFTDNDLVDFALGMPPRMRAGGLFYLRMIAERLPKVAGIIYGRTGHPVKFEAVIQQYPWFERIDYLQRQIVKRVWRGQFQRSATCIPQAEAIRAGSRQYVTAILSRAEYLEDLFDMRAIRQMLDDHIAGRINAFKSLGNLVSFSLWRQQFCSGQVELVWPGLRPAYQETAD